MSYFVKKQINEKCTNCILAKKDLIEERVESNILHQEGTIPEILIIFEAPEPSYYLHDFIKFVKKKGLTNFVIKAGLKCRSKNFELPNPVYKIYKNCNSIIEDDVPYKVIITVGRAINAITKTSDIISWLDFGEHQFNSTYFYTGVDWNKKIRVYPIPGITGWMNVDTQQGYFVIQQLKLIQNYLRNYKKEEKEPYILNAVKDYNNFFKEHMNESEFAIDTETTGLNVFEKGWKCRTVTISFDGITGYYLEFDKINKRLFSKFLKGKEQFYANGKYDCKVLVKSGIKNAVVNEDIIILSHVLSTMRMRNSLKTCAWLIGLGGYDSILDNYWKKNKGITWATIPHSALYEYATLDAIVTYRVVKYLLKWAEKQPEVYKNYKEIVIPVLPVFQSMETNGMEVDFNYVNKLHNELVNEKSTFERVIKKEFSIDNVNSIEQLAKAIELKGWNNLGTGKKFWVDEAGEKHHFYKVGEPQLSKWKAKGYDIADTILSYRSLDILNKTFVGSPATEQTMNNFFSATKETSEEEKGIMQYIMEDNKIHGIFSPGRTDTWRASSNSPNLMNQPKQGDEGKRFRPCYKCPDDYLICEADYSGFQLRIGAIYSGDKVMQDIFVNHGGDMHSITAQSIFCRDKTLSYFLENKNKEPYKTYRFRAKCFIAGTKIVTNNGDLFVETFVPEICINNFVDYDGEIKVIDRYSNQKNIHSTIFSTTNITILIELDNGDIFEVTETHEFPIKRNDVEIIVEAKDLLETDEFIESI